MIAPLYWWPFSWHSTGEATKDTNSRLQTSPTQLFKFELWTLDGKSWFAAYSKFMICQFSTNILQMYFSMIISNTKPQTTVLRAVVVDFIKCSLVYLMNDTLCYPGGSPNISLSLWPKLDPLLTCQYITWAAASVAFAMNAFMSKCFLACIVNKKVLWVTTHKVQLYLIQRVTQWALGAKIPFQVVGLSCILYQYQGEMPLIPNFCWCYFE